jgi:hypothetical protein
MKVEEIVIKEGEAATLGDPVSFECFQAYSTTTTHIESVVTCVE